MIYISHNQTVRNISTCRLSEQEARHRHDVDQKMVYQRTVIMSNDKQLEARDRANKHRIKSLEDQVLLCHGWIIDLTFLLFETYILNKISEYSCIVNRACPY